MIAQGCAIQSHPESPWSVSFMQTIVPITDREIKVQESKASVVSHMDVSCTLSEAGFPPRMDIASRDPETPAACSGVKIRPSSPPWALLCLQLSCGVQLGGQGGVTLLGRVQLGAEGGWLPRAQVQAFSPVFHFISLRSLGRAT